MGMQKVSYDDVIADLLITVGYLVDSQHDRRFISSVVRQPLFQAFIEVGRYGLTVEVLTDENEFLHPVAVGFFPILLQSRVLFHELAQLKLRHGCVPLSRIAHAHLFSGLFENVTDVLFAVEVGQSLAADDVLGPFSCHEVIEEVDVERASAIIDKRLDVVFQRLATFFVVQVVVVVVPVMVVMVVVFVVMVLLSLDGRNP